MKRAFITLNLLVLIIASIAVTDRLMTRESRILLDKQKEKFGEVSDAILRFKLDHNQLPTSLDALVPDYLPDTYTKFQPSAKEPSLSPISWNVKTRKLYSSTPFLVEGLYTRKMTIAFQIPDIPVVEEAVSQTPPAPPNPASHTPNPASHTPNPASHTPNPASHTPTPDSHTPNPDSHTPNPASHTPNPDFHTPNPASHNASLSGEPIVSSAGTQRLPEDSIVVEAESFQETTYGWDIAPDSQASGGFCLYIREGRGDLDHTFTVFRKNQRTGDYYNVTNDNRQMLARCYFNAPRAGYYNVAVRTKAHRNKCSNAIYISINRKRYFLGYNGSTPFIWLWHRIPREKDGGGKIYLQKGLNQLTFTVYQDDVKVDQIVFSPRQLNLPHTSSKRFSGGFPDAHPLLESMPEATLSLSAGSLNVSHGQAPEIWAYLRNNRGRLLKGTLEVQLEKGNEAVKTSVKKIEVTAPLTRFPCAYTLPANPELREYVIRCRFKINGTVVQERVVAFGRGYDWSILGPLPFMGLDNVWQPEKDSIPARQYRLLNKAYSWQPYDHKHTGYFPIMDFGNMFSGQTYQALPNAALYGYTEVDAKRGGSYILKALGDDHIVVWVNGERVLQVARDNESAIRNARDQLITLKSGRNTILFRLNQLEGQWQAGLWIRGLKNTATDVVGIPFADQEWPGDK